MKATGIVRKIDFAGRLVFPMQLRCKLDIKPGDYLEMYTEEGYIYLQKHEPVCLCCENTGDTINYKGKDICRSCLEELKQIS